MRVSTCSSSRGLPQSGQPSSTGRPPVAGSVCGKLVVVGTGGLLSRGEDRGWAAPALTRAKAGAASWWSGEGGAAGELGGGDGARGPGQVAFDQQPRPELHPAGGAGTDGGDAAGGVEGFEVGEVRIAPF